MISNGFVPVPRSVLTDPRYKSARLKYQKVLWVIFEMAAFKPTKHVVGKNLIDIEIGQFCVTIRKLAEICNKEVKYEDDLIDRNLIDRAISYWEACQYVRQTFLHKKTLLTITIPEFYEKSNKSSLEKTAETTSETTSETKKTSVNNNKLNSYEKKESITETTSETTSETSARHKRTKRTKKEIKETFFNVEPSLSQDEKEEAEQAYASPSACQKQEDLELVSFFIDQNHLTFKPGEVNRWTNAYGAAKLLATLDLLTRQPKVIRRPSAWMQNALKNDYAGKEANEVENRLFAIEFKQKKQWYELKVTKKYCSIETTGYDLKFDLPPENFKQMLEEKFENLSY